MKFRHLAAFSILGAFGLYEVYALSTTDTGDTWSEMTWNTAQRYPLLPFALGVLMGHFFWQSDAAPHYRPEKGEPPCPS